MPNETFLSYLWQFQQFDRTAPQTEQGETLMVLHPGRLNTNAGADFQEARLLIGDVEWAGTIELHRRSSDWFQHQHQHDPAYENVVLHVVWQHDTPVYRHDGTEIPTLALASRTDLSLLNRYEALLASREVIPCAAQFGRVAEIIRFSMLDKTLMQRLETKAEAVTELLNANGQDWEETAWQILARAFGAKINAEPMRQLAQTLPLKIIQKHRGNLFQIEALLFGTAGLLPPPDCTDDYAVRLRKEFQFLGAKYKLLEKTVGQQAWKFMRLRPANFPTVRLAQLAWLVDQQASIFSLLVQNESGEELRKALSAQQSAYWQTHYVWGKPSTAPVPSLGRKTLESLLINAVVPLLVCYAKQRDQPAALDRAIALLESLPAEQNQITAIYTDLGQKINSAFDSQGAIEWYKHFCAPRQCLRCNVGVALLKQ
ncbi:MAG: DUF2851 family protein [Cytophagaceae bacterium]|nr:DUF2851 family protein [Cytophagaceae bacterium]